MRIFMLGFIVSLTLWTGGLYLIKSTSTVYVGGIDTRGRVHRRSKLARADRLLLDGNRPIRENTVLCWVPIPRNGTRYVTLVQKTWGRWCDKVVFASEWEDPNLNVVDVKARFRNPSDLWKVIEAGWFYMYTHYVNDYDWFLKVDSDSYFSADNFRGMVVSHGLRPKDFAYIGHEAHHRGQGREFHLGAGYAISQYTLRELGRYFSMSDEPLPSGRQKCPTVKSWAEDQHFAECLRQSGFDNITWSRDLYNREYFMGFQPIDNLRMVRRNDSKGWFWKGKPKSLRHGIECCSSRPVLFHQLKLPEKCADNVNCAVYMSFLDYMLYEVAVDPHRAVKVI